VEPLELFTRRQVLSVSELVSQLKKHTEQKFDMVWVEGEISGLRRPGSGHYYFALKDSASMLKAVLFRHQAALVRFALEDGQQVLCQGRVSVYAPRGEVQLVVDTLEPRGAGALALAFEQIKNKLLAEGLFDQDAKQPLPALPQRVAVVTSPSGAALRDFLHVLHRNWPYIQVAVYPVAVQGTEAPGQMIAALEDLTRWGWPQVIVLTRGGGSPEDLWAYNDESLARALAACPIPLVSAVGHEVDVSISDLVADLRAPTPTAAAELLSQAFLEANRRLDSLSLGLGRSGQRMVKERRTRLTGLRRALTDPSRRLADKRLRLDDLIMRAGHALRAASAAGAGRLWRLEGRIQAAHPGRRLTRLRSRQDQLEVRLRTGGLRQITVWRNRWEKAAARLRALGPMSILGRGYALVTDEQGRILRRSSQTEVGQRIKARLAKGVLGARVEKVEP
jgi:exodeoxyribonuclease VII large subunit